MREAVLIFAAYAVLLCFMLVFQGCGSGEDDQQESVSSESNVDIVDCSGATFDGLSAAEVEQIVEDAEESGAEIIIDEDPPVNNGGLDQQLRTYKVTFIQGCGNTVLNEDNDVVSDDDVNTSVGSAPQ